MRIYFVSSKENLNIFKSFLPKQFPTVTVHGSNSLEVAVNELITKSPVNPYDLMIVTNQTAISDDMESGGQISRKLLASCEFALRDLPIYFLIPSSKKAYGVLVTQNFSARNIEHYYYQGSMKKDDILNIIKRVSSLQGVKKDELLEQARTLIDNVSAQVDSIPVGDSYLGKTVVSGINISDKIALLQKFSKNTNKSVQTDPEQKIKYLNDIRSKIINITRDDVTLETIASNETAIPSTLIEISEGVKDYLTPESIHKVLCETDETYASMQMVKTDIESAIDNISDEVGHEKDVLDLLTVKTEIINKMVDIEVSHLVEVTNEISKMTQEQFRNASSLTRLNITEMDLGSLGNDIHSIELKKELRGSLVSQVENTAVSLNRLMSSIGVGMNALGANYNEEIKTIQQHRIEYANEKNVILDSVSLPVNIEATTKLAESYKIIHSDFGSLQKTSSELIESFGNLIQIDSNIINHQTKVIQDLVIGNVKKVVNVGSTLEAKSIMITSKDTAGKTVIGAAVAKSFSERGMKVAVIDLDLESPSLHLYSNTLKVGYEIFLKDISFKLNSENPLNFIASPAITNCEFKLDGLVASLNSQVNTFDRILYLSSLSSPLTHELQKYCKATIFVTDSDVSNIHDLVVNKEILFSYTPINTVVINKCSQFVIQDINNILTPLQLDGIATIPVLYYSKFDYCKLKNIEPYNESQGILETANKIITSIE